MNKDFARATEQIPVLFAKLAAEASAIEKVDATLLGRKGVYAFFEGGRPVHVGRTRNLLARLRGHFRRNHYSATFAFKQARLALKLPATYKPEGSRAALAQDARFRPVFEREIARVRRMSVRFVDVSDPVSQYLLELYAHLEWELPLGEFDTH